MSSVRSKILVIDDERSVCISCMKILQEVGYEVDYEMTGKAGVDRTLKGNYEIILLDLRMPDMSGMEALNEIVSARPDVTVIIITGYASIQTSIDAIKKGASDYIPKPFSPSELEVSVAKAMEGRRLRSENEYLKQQLYSQKTRLENMIGESEAMRDLSNHILKIAPTEFSVLIIGESGTGKELIAQAIHSNSLRKNKQMVAVDVSALPPSLIESELFGHHKGSFTGATSSKPGYLTIADGGTLFLDEISNLTHEVQGVLLRVLESKMVRPVGDFKEQKIDIRLIAATNQDLFELVEGGEFREDLYYRLNVIPVRVPPLRERVDDIPVLVAHFLEKAREKTSTRIAGFSNEAMAKMFSYHWPGNVRELKNIVERLVGTVDSEIIGVEDLPESLVGRNDGSTTTTVANAPQNIEQLKKAKESLKKKMFRELETSFLLKALEDADWNVTRAAEAVGIARPNFHALMRKHGIKRK